MLYQGVLLTRGQEMFLRTGCLHDEGFALTSFCYRNHVPIGRYDGTVHGNRLELANPSTLQSNTSKSQSYLTLSPFPKLLHKCATCSYTYAYENVNLGSTNKTS